MIKNIRKVRGKKIRLMAKAISFDRAICLELDILLHLDQF